MPNYANLVGFALDDDIANLYVPGRETALGPTADRYAIDLASAPIGNLVSEFLPDVASPVSTSRSSSSSESSTRSLRQSLGGVSSCWLESGF